MISFKTLVSQVLLRVKNYSPHLSLGPPLIQLVTLLTSFTKPSCSAPCSRPALSLLEFSASQLSPFKYYLSKHIYFALCFLTIKQILGGRDFWLVSTLPYLSEDSILFAEWVHPAWILHLMRFLDFCTVEGLRVPCSFPWPWTPLGERPRDLKSLDLKLLIYKSKSWESHWIWNHWISVSL